MINQIRNLQQVAIGQFSTLNFFIGDNGSGKTSLLEAIAIASLGRSFRSNKVQTVINKEAQQLSVFIEATDQCGTVHKLGIQRDRKNKFLVRINGNNAKSLAELTAVLPIVILDATAFDLLDGSPSVRRKFIDWGVFHVEHHFYETWKNYNRIIKQRNTLLRQGISDYALYRHWDKELVDMSIKIEAFRLGYLRQFQSTLNEILQILDPELIGNKVIYKNGWGLERLELNTKKFLQQESLDGYDRQALHAVIESSFERDLKYQRTHFGPHKADIEIKSGRNSVKDIFSRGQKKTLVAAMKLAQAKVVFMLTGKCPILLLDDLPSELDKDHLSRFINYIIQEQYQTFITSVDEAIYHDNKQAKARMFHVERGKITPVNGDRAEGER